MPSVNPVPDGYRTLAPYLIVSDGAGALAFYEKFLGGKLRFKLDRPDGKIGHAELQLGDCVVMFADEAPEHQAFAPPHFGGSPVSLHLYVADVDAVVAGAVAVGATLIRPVADQFYGDRSGTIADPFGHIWHLSTHIEDVAMDELDRRTAALHKEQGE